MLNKKSKLATKIAVFMLITTLFLWLLPAGLISAESNGTTEGSADTVPPVITLNGVSPVTVGFESTYLDAGATATDEVDGNVAVIADYSAVNTAIAGTYSVTYNASDITGNAAETAVRTVVVEAALPVEPALVAQSGQPVFAPALTTDKGDYAPEETPIISGTGFLPNTIYTIVIVRPDGQIVTGDGTFTPGSDKILTNGAGTFDYSYILIGIMGTYQVKAVDESGNIAATTSFTDCSFDIYITKYAETNGQTGFQEGVGGDSTLAGAYFTLYKLNSGSWIQILNSGPTTASGTMSFHVGAFGTYKVVETTAPAGYIGGWESGDIVVDASNDYSHAHYYALNNPTYGFTVNVIKGISGTGFGTFSFVLEKQDPVTPANWSIVASLSGISGAGTYAFVPSSPLTLGTYRVSETSNGGATYTAVDLTSMPASAPGNVTTSGSFTWAGTTSGFQNVYFLNVIPSLGSITVTKTGLEGSDTAVFTLTGPIAPLNKTLDNNESDATNPSTFTWNNLPYGSYTVTESYPASGNVYTYTTNIGAGNQQAVSVNANTPNPGINVTNSAIKGTVNLTKTFEGLSPLPAVNFYLKDSTGQYYSATGALVSKAAAARAISGNGTIQWTGLPVPRNYIIEEDTVAHYSQTITPSSFTIDANTPRQFQAVTATNTQKANVDLTKTFVGGFVDANFYLTDGTHYFKQDGSEAESRDDAKVIVNSNTTVHWVDLPNGNSYVMEEDPIPDYTSTGLPLSFGMGPGATTSLAVTNTRNHCDVNIVKLIDGAPAAEGVFGFTGLGNVTAAGAAVTIGISDFSLPDAGNYNKTFTLYCGIPYTITENSIPAGYAFGSIAATPGIEIVSQSGSSITFILHCTESQGVSQAVSEVIEIRVPNTITFNNTRNPGFIRLTKTDSVTGGPVKGAEYWVFDSAGVHVETLITGPDGSVTVSGFKWGTYTVKEMKAPVGYLLDPTVYTVVINAANTTVSLNVKDTPTGGGEVGTLGLTEGIQVLAFTGIDPIIPISGGSAIAAGIAMFIATLRRRNKYSAKHTSLKEDEKGSD